jgi:hypothetical protein
MAASDVTLDGSPAKSAHAESTGFPSSTSSGSAAAPAWVNPNKLGGTTAGLQSTTSANTTIIENKPGPECSDNILHNYANYTYKISVLAWNSIKDYNKEIQFGSWETLKNSVDNKKILWSSGGIADDAVTVSIAGTNISSSKRHPDFDVDFYITSFTTTSIMGLSGESRATNIFECNMEVTEPIGATLLERIYSLVTTNESDRENWAEYPLLIKIEFVGYDDAGDPHYIQEAMRMIPVRIINMEFNVSGDGSNYGISFLAQATIKKDHPHFIAMNSKEMYGHTVKDFLDQFAEHYNKEQKAKTVQAVATAEIADASIFGMPEGETEYVTGPKTQMIADEIEFLIDPMIRDEKILFAVAEEAPLRVDPRSGQTYTPQTKDAKKALKKQKKIVDLDPNQYVKITIPKGTKQVAAIEKVVTFSTFITDQLEDTSTLLKGTTRTHLKDKKLLKNPDQGLLWWNISYVPLIKGWDDMRGQYARKTIIQIEPYRVADPVTTGGICKVGEGVIAPAMRNYQYIYTGYNIDIKDFAVAFNNSFIQSMLGQGTADQATLKVDKKDTSVEEGGTKDKSNALQTAAVGEHDRRYSTGSKNKSNKQNTAGTILERLYRQLGSDMMQCTISVIGDPCYIEQDGLLNLGMNAKTGKVSNNEPLATDPANGAALCDHQDGHIYISYKTPTDYNEETGLMDFNMGNPKHRSSTLSGYYRVWEVVNTFQSGEFNQSLNLTRIYGQWREATNNPEKTGGGNDRAEFTQEGASLEQIANAINTSGGSAKLNNASNSALTTEQKKQIARQKLDLQNQIDIEQKATLRDPTDPGVLSEQDFKSVSSNTSIANKNAANKQNTNEAKIKFRAAEAKLANINAISDTTSLEQRNTFADNVNAMGNNTDTLSQAFDNDSLNPTFSESGGQPTHTTIDGLRSHALHVATTTNNIGVRFTDNNGMPLFDYNKKDGLYGLAESGISMATYTSADKTSVNTNDETIRTQRELLIATGDLIAKKAAYVTANTASKDNQTIHGKYGNRYRTWEEVGYFQNLLIS